MTSDQFTEVAQLLRLRQSPQTDALRAVMVDGISQAEASRRFGVAPAQIYRALVGLRDQVATAKAVADALK